MKNNTYLCVKVIIDYYLIYFSCHLFVTEEIACIYYGKKIQNLHLRILYSRHTKY